MLIRETPCLKKVKRQNTKDEGTIKKDLCDPWCKP
jgi:hypothetical protein